MEQPRLEVRPKSADLPKSCQFPGMISKPNCAKMGFSACSLGAYTEANRYIPGTDFEASNRGDVIS